MDPCWQNHKIPFQKTRQIRSCKETGFFLGTVGYLTEICPNSRKKDVIHFKKDKKL